MARPIRRARRARGAWADYDVGFAFDGDGDRVLAVDRGGEVVDGDELIALAALTARGRAPAGRRVAVTVMTNYGFHTAMARPGIEVATTAVGDRYVLEELRPGAGARRRAVGPHHRSWLRPSGDGIASALLTLEALGGRDLAERDAMQKLPQRLVNLRAASRGALVRPWRGGRHGAVERGRRSPAAVACSFVPRAPNR